MNEEIMFTLIKNGTFTITLANTCTQKPPYIHFRRKPSEFILYYIYEGEFFLKDGEEEYHISKNDILILDPSREHYGLKATECKFAYVHFISDSFVESNNSSGGCLKNKFFQTELLASPIKGAVQSLLSISRDEMEINVPKYLQVQSSNNVLLIREHLTSLISIFNKKSMYYEEMTANLLKNILLSIALEYKNINEIGNSGKTKSIELSSKIIEFINDNYSKELNSKEFEKYLGYNFDYLNRCFKKQTNYTIFYYLNMIRIEKSKELISTGIYTFEDIASNIGFSDIYYFNKVFKKYVGVTPGKFKRDKV